MYKLCLLFVLITYVAGGYPIFPDDFAWSSAGWLPGKHCLRILESADPNTWDDNYLCWNSAKSWPAIYWSSAGPIQNMRCTQILETADPHTWNDNYLCVPPNSKYVFLWSSAGPIPGLDCLQWLESADPHTWDDNYLCGVTA